MKKTLITLAFALTLIFALAIFGASAASEGTPISNAEEFKAIQSGTNYYLTNDIDFGGVTFTNYIVHEYYGNIDGNGYALLNFSIEVKEQDNAGVIASYLGGWIKDLTIGSKAAPISMVATAVPKNSQGYALLAGFVGGNKVYASRIENVHVYGNINMPYDWKANVSLMTGYVYTTEYVNCSTNGSITVGDPTTVNLLYHNIGGFSGSSNGALYFNNCVNNADITLAECSLEARVGGFAGYAGVPIVYENCANYGDLKVLGATSDVYVGQLLGGANYGVQYVKGSVKLEGSVFGESTVEGKNRVGNIAGGAAFGVVVDKGITVTNPIGAADHQNLFVDLNLDPKNIEGAIAINDAAGLAAIDTTKFGYYYLTADIDLGDTVFTNYVLSNFNGVLDGCGHKITGIVIKGDGTQVDTGIIQTVDKFAAILNVDFGTAEKPIKISDIGQDGASGAKKNGTLIGAGTSRGVAIYNVNVYVDYNANINSKNQFGGVAGGLCDALIVNTNTYGNMVVSKLDAKNSYYVNSAGFVGNGDRGQIYINCTNGISITCGDSSAEMRTAGFIGWAGLGVMFIDCTNTGSMVNNGTVNAQAAGFVGQKNANNGALYLRGCENKGTFSIPAAADDQKFIAGVIAKLQVDHGVVLVNFKNSGAEPVVAFSDPAKAIRVTEITIVENPDTSDTLNIVAVISVAVLSIVGSAVVLTSIRKRREFNA